jgi:hypothetical protein
MSTKVLQRTQVRMAPDAQRAEVMPLPNKTNRQRQLRKRRHMVRVLRECLRGGRVP